MEKRYSAIYCSHFESSADRMFDRVEDAIAYVLNNNDKVRITRPLNQYLAYKNKDLAKEIVKPKATVEFKNVDFKNIEQIK